MLHDLDHGRRVEPGQPVIPIQQRPMDQPDTLALLVGQPAADTKTELVLRDLERSERYIHADDLGELFLPEQRLEQLALAAAQIENARGGRLLQSRQAGTA